MKYFLSRTANSHSSSHIIVAERGLLSIKANSPKDAPYSNIFTSFIKTGLSPNSFRLGVQSSKFIPIFPLIRNYLS